MQVVLEEIKFNHNPVSAFCDAFNIRKNETDFVTVPEWRRGETVRPEQSPAAYAIKAIRKNVITVNARFTCDDPTLRSVEVQAVNLRADVPTSGDDEVASTVHPPRPRQSEVLGWIPPQPVIFAKNGKSNFQSLKLRDAKFSEAGVSVSVICWQWQFRLGPKDSWKDIETTCHQIYTVLKIPRRPWLQHPHAHDNKQLPWTDVLDYACYWAKRAKDPDQVATKVTQSVRDLEKVFYITYDPSSFYSHPNFDCASFLRLMKDGIGKGNRLNCSDCATIVSTFANILGCALWQSIMSGTNSSLDNFGTNPIRLFGRTCWREARFAAHEVAWKCKCSASDNLFDASLELDGDDHPTKPPQKPLLARNLRFGALRDRQYLFRLLSPEYPGTLQPRPKKRKHREIRPNPTSNVRLLSAKDIARIKSLYEYDKWPGSDSPSANLSAQVFMKSIDPQAQFLDCDIVIPAELVETSNYPITVQQLLSSNDNRHIRLDIDFCSPTDKAREFLLERLGQFETATLKRRPDLEIGEIAFIEPEVGALLFLRANVIALVRNAGEGWVNPTDFGRHLDRFLLKLLASKET